MVSEDRRPAAGETWTFTTSTPGEPLQTVKAVDVLYYHPATHTVLGLEHGDKIPMVYYPHQWRQWQPPKPPVPDFVRYIHVRREGAEFAGRTTTRITTYTASALRAPTTYGWTVKVEVRDGKATATVLQ